MVLEKSTRFRGPFNSIVTKFTSNDVEREFTLLHISFTKEKDNTLVESPKKSLFSMHVCPAVEDFYFHPIFSYE